MDNPITDQRLLFAAFQAALRGATEYLRIHNLKASNDALKECVVSWVKIMLPEALSDAKEALDCHMPQIAEQTFAASMVNAGIQAAKECGMPVNS